MKTPITEEEYLKRQNKKLELETLVKNKIKHKKELKQQIREKRKQKHISKIVKRATNYFIKQINKIKSGQIIYYKFDKLWITRYCGYTEEHFKPVLDKLKQLYPYLDITMKVVDSRFLDDPPEIRIHPLLIDKTEYYITTENESNPEKCVNKIFFSDSSLEMQKALHELKKQCLCTSYYIFKKSKDTSSYVLYQKI